jgi:hypothetical protein
VHSTPVLASLLSETFSEHMKRNRGQHPTRTAQRERQRLKTDYLASFRLASAMRSSNGRSRRRDSISEASSFTYSSSSAANAACVAGAPTIRACAQAPTPSDEQTIRSKEPLQKHGRPCALKNLHQQPAGQEPRHLSRDHRPEPPSTPINTRVSTLTSPPQPPHPQLVKILDKVLC